MNALKNLQKRKCALKNLQKRKCALKNLQKRKCESRAGNPFLFIHKNTKLLVEKMFIRSFFIILCNSQLTDNNDNMCSRTSRVPFFCILILPLEVSLLRCEQLLGLWIPFLDSTPFQPSFGFASGFFVHPLKEIAPTLRAF